MDDRDLGLYIEATTKLAQQMERVGMSLNSLVQETKDIKSILVEDRQVVIKNMQQIIDNQKAICCSSQKDLKESVDKACKRIETSVDNIYADVKGVVSSNVTEYYKPIKKDTTWLKWLLSTATLVGMLAGILFKAFSGHSH